MGGTWNPDADPTEDKGEYGGEGETGESNEEIKGEKEAERLSELKHAIMESIEECMIRRVPASGNREQSAAGADAT